MRLHEEDAAFLYTHVVAARPDALFLSPIPWDPLPIGLRVANFEHGGAQFSFPNGSLIAIGGVSDRFAYGDATSMLDGYMTQFDKQLHCDEGVSMTTSETLLCEHLVRHSIRVGVTPVCVVRIRASGQFATYNGQTDFVYPPRGRPTGCRGLLFVEGPSDAINACDSLSQHEYSKLMRHTISPSAATTSLSVEQERSTVDRNVRCISEWCHRAQRR